MDKDLRDAFRALTLVRADLVATRQAKAESENQWRMRFSQQQQQYEVCATQLEELRETLAMRDEDEDVRAPKWKDEETETEPEREDEDANDVDHPSLEAVAKDQITLLTSVYDLQAQLQARGETIVAQEAQLVHERGEWALQREAMEHELATLREAERDRARDNKFLEEKFEFLRTEVDVVKRERDALQSQLEQSRVPEDNPETTMQDGLQRLKDQHDEHEEVLQRSLDSQAVEIHQLRHDLEATKASEEKKREIQVELIQHHEHERRAWAVEKETLMSQLEEATAKADVQAREIEDLQLMLCGKQDEMDSLTSDRTELLKQLEEIRDHAATQLRVHTQQEEERRKTQHSEQEKLQHELMTLLASFEAATAENALKMSTLQRRNDDLERTVAEHSRELEAANTRKRQLGQVVESYRSGLVVCRQDLQDQRQRVVDQQQEFSEALRVLETALIARCDRERAASNAEHRQLTTERDQAQDAARLLRDELTLTTAQHDDDRAKHETDVDELKTKMEELRERTQLHYTRRFEHERREQSLERQMMAAEDQRPTVSHTQMSWTDLATEILAFDDFLPQLGVVVGRLQTSLQLCAENARTMDLLSPPPSPLLTELTSLMKLARQWQAAAKTQDLSNHVRLVRRRVLATLAHWCEARDAPAPPFSLESREVAIVLEQWHPDRTEQARVAEWLRTVATTGIPTDYDDHATLELQDLSRDVKVAFCVLIVPLLQQNKRVHVRAFTRRVADVKRSFAPDEKAWELRIYVQAASGGPSQSQRRRSDSLASVASSTSSVTSSLSLASTSTASSNASALQLIHARLQQMQQH